MSSVLIRALIFIGLRLLVEWVASLQVMSNWKARNTEVNGTVLFTEEFPVAWAMFISLVERGYLSDPPVSEFPIHINIAGAGDKLPKYITKRGNSSLEG